MDYNGVDLDEAMLKVMNVTTYCEEGVSWQTISVKRRSNCGEVFETTEFPTQWFPSVHMRDAMDVVERFREPYGGTNIEMGWEPNNNYWFCRIGDEEVYDSDSLPKAICRCVLKHIQARE